MLSWPRSGFCLFLWTQNVGYIYLALINKVYLTIYVHIVLSKENSDQLSQTAISCDSALSHTAISWDSALSQTAISCDSALSQTAISCDSALSQTAISCDSALSHTSTRRDSALIVLYCKVGKLLFSAFWNLPRHILFSNLPILRTKNTSFPRVIGHCILYLCWVSFFVLGGYKLNPLNPVFTHQHPACGLIRIKSMLY